MRVDFSVHTGIPLFKRQNTFSVAECFDKDGRNPAFLKAVTDLKELRGENMRLAGLGEGSPGGSLAQGTPESMTHDFSVWDEVMERLFRNGTQPYFCYFPMPRILRPDDGTWRSAPRDFQAWQQFCSDFAAHYAQKGWPLAAHEIWNEPDLYSQDGKKVFYDGTWEDFIRMYEYAVRGIRQGDPQAKVGGLSIAFLKFFDHNCVRQFLGHVLEKQIPMDFVSYHNYDTERYIEETGMLNAILNEYGDAFRELELHLNEFHVRRDEEWQRGITGSAHSACLAIEAIARLVEMPTVTSVNWATWRDMGEGLSLVDNETGERSALFHTIAVYNDMPVDRVLFEGTDEVHGFASADENAASVMLWNCADNAQQLEISLNHLPFERVDVQVYAIDKYHSSILDGCEGDGLQMIDTLQDVSAADLVWRGQIEAWGIVYIKAVPAGRLAEKPPVWDIMDGKPVAGGVAKVVRKEYYFEDRNSTAFSEFDLGSFTAWAGMGDRESGLSRGAVVLADLPEKLRICPSMYGALGEGTCTLCAEYRNEQGEIVSTEAWRTDGNKALVMDQEIILMSPENFTGTLKLTWCIEDAQKDATIKLKIMK